MAEYIEREAALNASKIVYIEYISIDGNEYEDGYADEIPVVFKSDIVAIPAADVVPVRHGRWREIENGESGRLCECSACKEWLLFYYGFVANYCPNCGAKMMETENEQIN